MTAKQQLWIGYRVFPDGSKRRLTPGGKPVFGEAKRVWLLRRAKLLGHVITIKKYTPTLPPKPSVTKSTMVSEHFAWAEFASRDGVRVPPSLRPNALRLAAALEHVRKNLGGKPLPLLSVYRTPEHNQRIGGARGSKHITAEAADLNVPAILASGVTRAQLMNAIERVPAIHGIGVYPGGGVHVDVRAGRRARWSDWIRQ